MNRTNRSNFCFSTAHLKEIIRGKRSEVVREVVGGERRSALFGEDLTSEGDSGYNENNNTDNYTSRKIQKDMLSPIFLSVKMQTLS